MTAEASPTAASVFPDRADSLVAVLEWHVAAHPDRVHIQFMADDDSVKPISYRALHAAAREVATGLLRRGLLRGQAVAIMLGTSPEYFYAFLGTMLAGGVPVPIYPPTRKHQLEQMLRRQAAILHNAEAVLLITVPEARDAARFVRALAPKLEAITSVAEVRLPAADEPMHRPVPDDLAFLQYTSGSTGNPKGVMLTHANLLANVRAMGGSFGLDPAHDVFVSWLPLYHDMGLIGAWMGCLYHGVPLALMSPLRFLARPERWLQAIDRFRGTITAAPNFAYDLCTARIKASDLAEADLSSLRIAANGAEAVLPSTLRDFQRRFGAYGLRATALKPVYGLAENCVGLAMSATERPPSIDRIRREALTKNGVAELAPVDDATALEFPACGAPLAGHEISVVDSTGRQLPERTVGSIQFRGPSATQGYFRNTDATRALFDGEWLRTGDLGYLAGGEIHITGREKDVIIRAGRNLYAPEIEAAAARVLGIRKGCVAAFGVRDERHGTERLVILAETRETGAARLSELNDAVSQSVRGATGESADEVVLVRPSTILKTSSGKIRRGDTRALFERGEHLRRMPPWLETISFGARAIAARLMGWAGSGRR